MSFTYSFRSGPAILQSVDHVFRDEAIYRSIHAARSAIRSTIRSRMPGRSLIDLWEPQLPDGKQDIEGWRAPFDAVSETSPEVRLARRIQAEIKSLIDGRHHDRPAATRRPLRYGDVLVLVRRRGNAFDAVIQALKHANIPVAGADRLKLTEHIAIIDLMHLADALLLPQDDLALAVALKSPLFGLDDDDLFTLAWQRKGSLRRALGEHAATSEKFRSGAAPSGSLRAPLRDRDAICLLCVAAGRRRRPRANPEAAGHEATTRWMNFSNSRWLMSARRPPRCKVSWRGCAPPTPR